MSSLTAFDEVRPGVYRNDWKNLDELLSIRDHAVIDVLILESRKTKSVSDAHMTRLWQWVESGGIFWVAGDGLESSLAQAVAPFQNNSFDYIRSSSGKRGGELIVKGLSPRMIRDPFPGDIFRNAIDDYIERVNVAPGERTFVNLTEGVLTGLEAQAAWQPSAAWRLLVGGHTLEGEDGDGNPLADIPQDEVFAGLRWRRGRVDLAGRWTVRLDKSDPGPAEDPIDGAHLLRAGVTVRLDTAWRVEVFGSNLLDEAYYPSPDEDAALAPGRSVGIRLGWAPLN